MSLFSCQEKSVIIQYVMNNSLDQTTEDSESKWRDLGEQIGRDWEEVRYFYLHWKSENRLQIEHTHDNASGSQQQSANVMHINGSAVSPLSEDNLDEFLLAYDGLFFNTTELTEAIINPENDAEPNPESALAVIENYNPNYNSRDVEKRKSDDANFDEFDRSQLKILENQSRQELDMKREELEMKRRESEKKIMLLDMQLRNGEEIHREKMKILNLKKREAEQKIIDIDTAICKKNLTKKFKK